MTLDLSKPEHREALRWAAKQWQRDPIMARIGANAGRTTWAASSVREENLVALRALSSPTESAAIVRAELERCGATATVRIVAAIEPPYLSVDDGTYDNMISSYDVPALILALLDATDRDSALAALREVGR